MVAKRKAIKPPITPAKHIIPWSKSYAKRKIDELEPAIAMKEYIKDFDKANGFKSADYEVVV